MPDKLVLDLFIPHEREDTYFTLPFTVPPDTESIALSYRYLRHAEQVERNDTAVMHHRREVNIVDLGLVAPGGAQAGASGSDKTEISLSETFATPGYKARPITAGEWQILVGAYKIASDGVNVVYEITFTPKRRRLLKGDLHMHTVASDGVLTPRELGRRALRHGLDFLAITDHNQMVSAASLPSIPGLTIIPGFEWTHFRGHASMLGVDQPFDGVFAANTVDEVHQRFHTAAERGAVIIIDHPFEKGCEFQFDIQNLPFDCLEVWNGPMREPNLRAIGWWHSLLTAGKKIPICGGSDYHRDTPFIFPGGPTTCVYAMSAGKEDILAALRQGCGYITFAPNGPSLEMTAGEALLGGSVVWQDVKELDFAVDGLLAGDVVHLVANHENIPLYTASSAGSFRSRVPVTGPGFVRVEILRAFLPGIPMLPALISNPIYFE